MKTILLFAAILASGVAADAGILRFTGRHVGKPVGVAIVRGTTAGSVAMCNGAVAIGKGTASAASSTAKGAAKLVY